MSKGDKGVTAMHGRAASSPSAKPFMRIVLLGETRRERVGS